MIEASLLDHLRNSAYRWAEQATIPADVVERLVAERLFKLFVPTWFGGRQSSLLEAVNLYADLARADGSIGWLVQIGAGGGFFVPSFSREIAEQLFAPEHSVIAGSGYTSGIARRVRGGYRVQGTWRFASGAQYASIFTVNARLADDGSIRAFAFDRSQVRITPDWHAFGMRATSSWTFEVHDVFVPEERSFVVGEHRWEPPLSVYQTPFLLFALSSMGAVAFGLGLAFFEEAAILFEGNPSRLDVLSIHEAQATAAWREFIALVAQISSHPPTDESIEMHRSRLAHLLNLLRQSVLDALPHCGMAVADEHTRLSRILRDFLVIWQHELLRPSRAVIPIMS